MKVQLGNNVAEIYINHLRPDMWSTQENKLYDGYPSTVANIFLDGKQYEGWALCCPPDRFVKKVGMKLALKRAMKKANLGKYERTLIWKKVLGKTEIEKGGDVLMDPDENLKEQLSLAASLLKGKPSVDFEESIQDGQRLAELVLSLDGWISKGGFLPNKWRVND